MLAVHSGAGGAGYAASDRVPERIAAMVYVDSGPATGALEPDFNRVEKPLPSREELEEENVDGLSEEQLATFRRRAVPQPGGVLREGPMLTNAARLDVPTTVICTGFPSEQVKAAMNEGHAWLGGLTELHDVTWVDLPTSHWPMWCVPGSSPRSSATSRRLDAQASDDHRAAQRRLRTSVCAEIGATSVRPTLPQPRSGSPFRHAGVGPAGTP